MTTPAGRSWAIGVALLASACILHLAQTLSFGNCLQDDAYISLRYARHLAEGEGLVFNAGERVEGYTNFSWTVLHALPFALGTSATAFMRAAGILSGLAALLAVGALARRLLPRPGWAGGAAAFVAAGLPFLAAEAAMGLETAAFAALVALALARVLREWNDGSLPSGSGLLLGAAALTRPEGILVAGLVGLSDLARRAAGQRLDAGRLLLRWGSFVVLAGGHTAFRLAYYGDFVPNTFHAKVGGSWETAARGLSYSGEFAWAALTLVLLAPAGYLLLHSAPRRNRVRGWWLPAFVAVVYSGYVVVVGGDYKPSFRFFVVPAILAAPYVAVIASRLAARANSVRNAATLGLLVASVAWPLWQGDNVRAFARWRAEQIPMHRAAGRWLGEEASADAWLATGNAGMVPYYSRLPTIDMYGLNDRHIALRDVPTMGSGPAGHEKGDGAYVLAREPEFVLFQFARFSDRPLELGDIGKVRMSLSESELWADPAFLSSYELKTVRLPGFYFNFFRKVTP